MKIGFIGAGNMAKAILTGIYNSKTVDKKDIFVSNKTKTKLDGIKKEFGYNVSTDNTYVVENAKDIIFICVKPQVFDSISTELKSNINKNQLVVSIMAGKSINYLKKSLGTKNIVRVMPNTPCLVGAGVSAITTSKEILKSSKYKKIKSILKEIGEVIETNEKYINIITQVSGASPAFLFMFIEALVDGGVKCGMPRDMTYKFATNAVFGSGKLALLKYNEDKIKPITLKDMVTSKGGTTIEGVKALDKRGYREAIIEAVCKAYERSLEL